MSSWRYEFSLQRGNLIISHQKTEKYEITYVCVYVCMCVYVCSMYARTHVCICVIMYVQLYECVCVYVYKYVRIRHIWNVTSCSL